VTSNDKKSCEKEEGHQWRGVRVFDKPVKDSNINNDKSEELKTWTNFRPPVITAFMLGPSLTPTGEQFP
jgi:hypothetical protein